MLGTLLREDFNQIAVEQKVASEESIRFLLDYFKRNGQLENTCLIHNDDVVQYLRDLYSSTNYGHYQLMVESGIRNQLVQAEPDCIHYNAIDIYYDTTHFIVFIVDHAHGIEYHSYHQAYEDLELPIQYIVAGGHLYQADRKHCPIFTLQHLLLTAMDEDLKEQLFHLADEIPEKFIPLPWFELPPHYLLYMQSYSGLLEYVDYRKHIQENPPEEDCEELKKFNFDIRLSKYLNYNDEFNFKNKGIEILSAQFRDVAYQALSDCYTHNELIDILYAKRYPMAVHILKRALTLSQTHPIASFIFSNQPFLELLHRNQTNMKLSKKKTPAEMFYLIFQNQTILKLILTKELCPDWLFQSLTSQDGKKRLLDSSKIRLAFANLDLLEERVSREAEFNPHDFSPQELLFLSNTRAYSSPVVKELFFSGQIDKNYVKSISHEILPTEPFSTKTINEWKEVLNHIVITHSPISVVASFTPPNSKQTSFFTSIDEKKEEDSATQADEFFGLMSFGSH